MNSDKPPDQFDFNFFDPSDDTEFHEIFNDSQIFFDNLLIPDDIEDILCIENAIYYSEDIIDNSSFLNSLSFLDTDFFDTLDDDSISINMHQSVRCSEKLFFDTSIVKCTLNTFFSPNIADIIKRLVTNFSRISFAAHHIANIRFLDILEHPNPHFPLLNQQFFAEAIYQVAIISDRKSNKSYPVWNNARSDFDSCLPSGFIKPSRDKLIVSYLAQQMETEAKNHLNMNFRNRFKKYLKLTYSLDKEIAYYIVSSIMNDPMEDLDRYQKEYNTSNILEILNKYKKLLISNQTPKKKSKKAIEEETEEDIDESINIMENLDSFIPFLKQIMTKFKELNMKGFTLLPLKKGFIPSFITLDTLGLAKIISMYEKKSEQQDVVKNNPRQLWNDYTNIKNYEPKNEKKKFNYLIETNGYEVSIHLRKHKKNKVLNYPENADLKMKYDYHQKLKQEKIERDKQYKLANKNKKNIKETNDIKNTKKIPNEDEFPKYVPYEMQVIPDFFEYKAALGLDPGKRYFYVASDKNGNYIKCTGKEYYHYLQNPRTKTRVNKRKNLVSEIKELSKYSFKVNNKKEYMENLRNVYRIVEKVWEEYEKRYYRSIRFRKIQRKAKVYKMLGDRLAGKEDKKTIGKETDKKKITLIGYGAGGKNGKGIGGASVPIKGFASYLMKRKNVKVVALNENFTSKKCNKCHNDLTVYKQWEKEKKEKNDYKEKPKKKLELKKKLDSKVVRPSGEPVERPPEEQVPRLPDEQTVLKEKSEETDAPKLRKVYGLLRCKSNVCCNIVLDRDENASRCLYDILEAGGTGKERPEYLRKQVKPS